MMFSKRGKRFALIGAGVLLVAAIVWSLLLGHTSESTRIARAINAWGYRVLPQDIYAADEWENHSIRTLLPETDLAAAVDASSQVGLPSDIDRVGHIVLVLANISNEDVITLFLVDGEIELGFLQTLGTNDVRALTGMDE